MIIEENDLIDDHQAWVDAVKKASEKALRETANLPMPQIHTQIPDKPLNRIKNNYCKTYLKFSQWKIDAQERERQRRKAHGEPEPKSQLSTEVEWAGDKNPRLEIYRVEDSDRWKCSKCKAKGDRWYMLYHICKKDL